MSETQTSGGFTVKVGNKEVEINLELYRIIQDYLKNSYTLDVLAEKLGLDDWSEAYEFIAALPQWVVWFTETQLQEYLSKLPQEQQPQQQQSAPKRGGRRRKEQGQERVEGRQPAQEGGEKPSDGSTD